VGAGAREESQQDHRAIDLSLLNLVRTRVAVDTVKRVGGRGVGPATVRRVRSVPGEADESRYLHLWLGVPVLDVWHTSVDQDGEPFELTRFVMRGDMTGLLYDVPVE